MDENNLKYFQNIAKEDWKYKYKKFDFQSIQNIKYELIDFIRDNYEFNKRVNKTDEFNDLRKI